MIDEICSEAGWWRLEVQDDAIVSLQGIDAPGEGAQRTPQGDAVRAYFAGELRALDGVRIAPSGTAFQRAVWAAVRAIPAGETRTYGAIAKQLGSAPRAVGGANGANRVALVIPCHRVVSPDGLRGYAWGLERKRWLLTHEHCLPGAS